MFKLVTLEDTIRIPPEKFGEASDEVARELLKARYEGVVEGKLGYVIAVTSVKTSEIGKIIAGDGARYHPASFSLLTFYPQIQEVVEGEIVELADFGAFVRVGPIDALLHVSQIMDDYISYDERQSVMMGKETRRKLTQGDMVRARITAVSFVGGGLSGKIGLTMRQPFLGKIEWIKEDLEKLREGEKKKEEGVSAETGGSA